jgi:catechol 2,3-dioxygenase-like lactoylglutathione lyase family enzyme
MIGYTTTGTNDLPRALNFYDAFMERLGATRIFNMPRGVIYGDGKGPMFGVLTPFDQQPTTPGNGAMIAFGVDTPEEVQRLYDFALSCGATDEGALGPRGDGMFYCDYFRDLDKNKFNIFCYLSAPA